MAHDVFISHSHADANAAKAVCAALEEAGIRCWMAPRDVLPGTDWADSIVRAVEAARVMVLLFSAHSSSSAQVHREVTLAATAGIAILPLRIDDTPLEGMMRYYLADTHWLDALDPPAREHIALAVSTVAGLLGREVPQRAAPAAGEPAERSRAASGTLPDDVVRSGWRRPSRRVVVVGVILAIALVGAGVVAVLQLTPGRASSPRPAGSTSASLPTYAEVVATYPSGAPVVAFEAQFDDIMLYEDQGYYVPIQGEYEGMRIRGAFTVNLDGAYIGSPGVLWEYIDDTRMPGWPPGSPAWDWTKYEKVVVPLAKKKPAFAALYYDTFNEMWGSRLTSNTTGNLGAVRVQPGDKLTFDAFQRLVQVSEW